MEMPLLGLRHRTQPGNWIFFELVGTEQGLQVRSTEVNGNDVVHGPVDQFSISYPEVLQLSHDIEKGKLAPPYGIGGNGLDTHSQVWQGEAP
jgi:hypothetical protein